MAEWPTESLRGLATPFADLLRDFQFKAIKGVAVAKPIVHCLAHGFEEAEWSPLAVVRRILVRKGR